MFEEIRKKLEDGDHMPSAELEGTETHVCLNCGTKFRGMYCPHCRQKADTGRLDLTNTFKRFTQQYINLDRGFLHTILNLLYRPGYMVRDYISGYRMEYVDPLMLVIILATIEFFLPDVWGTDEVLTIPDHLLNALSAHPFILKLVQGWQWIINDTQRMTLLICLIISPFIPLCLRILRIKPEHRLNVSESLHLMLYATCYIDFVEILLMVIAWLFPTLIPNEEAVLIPMALIFLLIILVMVRDCTSMGWKKLLLFLLIFPIAVTFCGGILLSLPSIIAKVSLPNDLYMQVKPLLQ